MAHLRLTGVTKSYGAVTALRGVDLEVEDGEFFALFGPSAAGKTTTLRIIAGLEKPDGGTLAMDGHDLAGRPVKRRDMAMVFQSFALYPHLTTFQNLAYPLRRAGNCRRTEVRQAACGEAAELLRVEPHPGPQAGPPLSAAANNSGSPSDGPSSGDRDFSSCSTSP